MTMALLDSWRKQVMAGNNSKIFLLIAITALSLVIFCSFLPSGEISPTPSVKVELTSHKLESLTETVSPIRSSSEAINYTTNSQKNNISVQVDDNESKNGSSSQSQQYTDTEAPLKTMIGGEAPQQFQFVEVKLFHNNSTRGGEVPPKTMEEIQQYTDRDTPRKTMMGGEAPQQFQFVKVKLFHNNSMMGGEGPPKVMKEIQQYTDREAPLKIMIEGEAPHQFQFVEVKLFHNNSMIRGEAPPKTMKEIQQYTDREAPLKTKQEIQQYMDRKAPLKTKPEETQQYTDKAETPSHSQCDIYSGKWVHDDSYPLYPAGECPYISQNFNCKANGRHDSHYTKWRWQPTHCDLPRLNPRDMLERLRGKRLMFVGDSLNRNQWESLLCIFRTVVRQNRKYSGGDGVTVFIAKEFNCSVEFNWAPFLVEQGIINAGNESRDILRLDAIDKHGAHWRDVDILVFNTGHWWTHGNKVQLRDFYMEGNYLHPELDPLVAFKRALTTWANWIDYNIDPAKTKVFFRGYSPTHFSSNQWNKPKGHKCNFERDPILEERYVNPYPERMKMVEEVVGQMKFPVSIMNITRLSDFRKDAHPAVYRGKKKLTAEQRKNPDQFGDCSHWCLPGLPDIWNELLYASLLIQGQLTDSHILL